MNDDPLGDANQPNQSLLKFAADNFAAFSAISSAVAASLSMVFIFGYLAVFNTSLIRILENSDIFKFILIGICIGFGVLAVSFNVINIIINAMKNIAATRSKFAMIILVLLLIVFPTLVAWRNNSPDLRYYVLRAVTGVTALVLLFFALRPPEVFINMTAINILSILILLYFFVYALGSTFGLYVDTDGTPHQITLRESTNTTRTLSDAKLVLFTSHHIIVKVGSEISVFQTADVVEVTSPTKDWLPLLPFQ